MEFLRRVFQGKNPAGAVIKEDERLPTYWRHAPPPEKPVPLEGAGEKVGPHVVRQVIQKPESGRLVLADFEGRENTPVFIKQYPSLNLEILEDPGLAASLSEKLETVIKVKHKLLYPLKSYSTHDEVFLVFEVVPEKTLQDQLDEVAVTPREAVAYTERLLQLADVFHAKGLKFGDIRPSSIWLTKDRDMRLLTGQWILDAAFNRRAERMCAANSQVQAGSVEFLSPEVIRGESTDSATDQYIIGAILFRLLTEKSVAGEDSVVLHRLMKIVGGDPPKASEMRPELGTGFDSIIERMLARDAKQRYATCSEICPLLHGALNQVPR